MEFVIDRLNRDLVEGWAFHTAGIRKIEVFVDGHLVGTVKRQVPRPDVAAAKPTWPREEATNSGFMFPFPHDTFRQAIGTVHLRFVSSSGAFAETEGFTVPNISLELIDRPFEFVTKESHNRAPFPAEIVQLLRALRGGDHYSGPWDDNLAAEAVSDLEFLLVRGSKHLPAIFSYSIYLKRLWETFKVIRDNFPRIANDADPSAKDAIATGSSIEEMMTISHHLYTLKRNGVPGSLIEFGCFKGFSTSLLSHACYDLGIRLHVFDSFAGLPLSESAYYKVGEFMGTIDEVKLNVSEFGRIECVEFHKGFFSETVLPSEIIPTCIWMDVDLERSARDVMTILPQLPRASCVFSHECSQTNFVDGTIRAHAGPDDVIQPILDAFDREGLNVTGLFLAGNTGAFWDENAGYPVLPTELVLRLAHIS